MVALALVFHVLFHGVGAEYHVEIGRVELFQRLGPVQVRAVVELFVEAGLAELVLRVRFDHQIVQPDVVPADLGQCLHLIGIFWQQQGLHADVAVQAPFASGFDRALEVADDAVKVALFGAVNFGVAGGGAGIERNLDPGGERQRFFYEAVGEGRGVGGEGHVNAGVLGGAHHLVNVFVQQRLTFARVHHAFDAQAPHLGQPGLEHAQLQPVAVVADVIHRAKGAAVVAGAQRRDLNINRVNRLGLAPVVAGGQVLADTLGMKNQLVAVDAKVIRHVGLGKGAVYFRPMAASIRGD